MSNPEVSELIDLRYFISNWKKLINIDENGKIGSKRNLNPKIFTKDVLAKLERDCRYFKSKLCVFYNKYQYK